MSTALVWFRNDLRLADNPALGRALAAHERVVPVYVHAPGEAGVWPHGAASRWWLHQSLAALDARLRVRGSRLLLRAGPSLAGLGALAGEVSAAAVYWNRRYEPALVQVDRAVKAGLAEMGTACESLPGNLLAEPWTVRTQAGGPFRVFTPFWRACQRDLHPLAPPPAPEALPPVPDRLASLPLAALGLLPAVPWHTRIERAWTPGEAAALARLEHFLDRDLRDYPGRRDVPSVPGTSRLSPHLHFGEVSPRQVAWALQAAEDEGGAAARAASEVYLRELGWREFAHHVLFHFPGTPDAPLDPRFLEFPWRAAAGELVRAWQRGRTGIPLVDAGMRELWGQGWMHNRVRMVVASLLTKNLRVPWQEGARWFWDTLVDADLANNTLGWQWASGCGADAAPYFRIFNPVRQGERFDPAGEYLRRWLPELARLPDRWIHQPWRAPAGVLEAAGVHLGRDYPTPVVDLETSREEALAAYRALTGAR
jgi:deoxyribodipyrimidine photo-lyase